MLTKIDPEIHTEQRLIQPGNTPLFLREYVARRGFDFSESNDLIFNFKKPVSARGTPAWHYKQRAITRLANELRESLKSAWLERATLVPMPPSKIKAHPEYDDRMLCLLRELAPTADIRELLLQSMSTDAYHVDGRPRDPEDLIAIYRIDEDLAEPTPRMIGIFDDVISTGAHYLAASRVIAERFPSVQITGIFLARNTKFE